MSAGRPAVLRVALAAAAYFALAGFGMKALSFQPEGIAAFWPPSGFLLAVFCLRPWREWPASLLALLAANTAAAALAGVSIPASLGFFLANAAGALFARWALFRFLDGPPTMGQVKDVVGLFLVVGVGTNALACTLEAAVSAFFFGAPFLNSWFTWWLADLTGMILLTPLMVGWAHHGPALLRSLTPLRVVEAAALALGFPALIYLVFGSPTRDLLRLLYPSFPLLMWAAIRFGPVGGALVSVQLGLLVTWYTLHGFGPFGGVSQEPGYRVLSAQPYLGGAALCALVLAALIAERRQAQDALRDAYAELEARIEERTRALSNANAELARSNAELEQFAYAASHDLQEPLRAVAGTIQIFQERYRGQVGPHADELIAHAVDGVTRMKTLIQDLLTYSRVGTRGLRPSACDCAAVLKEVLANLAAAIGESGARVSHGQLPTVMVDPSQMGQLLQNLIGNAIKFRSDRPPEIHIEAAQTGELVELVVRDNGIGIEPQYFDRIFGVFQRLHTRRAYPGTGIGLAICKKIVDRHGGRIWVESEPGRGTSFHFTLRAEVTPGAG